MSNLPQQDGEHYKPSNKSLQVQWDDEVPAPEVSATLDCKQNQGEAAAERDSVLLEKLFLRAVPLQL